MLLRWAIFLACVSGLRAVPLLVSMSTSIKYFDTLDTENITSLTPTTHLAIACDYHFRRGEFYYSDGLGRIYRRRLRNPNLTEDPVIIVEVKLSDGLAVDWVHDNLYWTDVTKQSVEVATLDGLYRTVLFDSKDGVDKPRAIVLDPFEGMLFWSDWGSEAKIESSGLDGKNSNPIVTKGLTWPNGLSLDLTNKKLYILDGFRSTLFTCDYDGSNLRVITRSSDNLQQAFGLTLYNSKLYWGSWRTRTLFTMNPDAGTISAVYKANGVRGIVDRMMGMKAVHPILQRPATVPDPCQSARCSHFCLVGKGLSTSCVCPFGYRLHPDGKTCIEQGYLFISWRRTIRRLKLGGLEEEQMFDDAKAAISLDYHLKKDLIFWSDIEEHRIYRAPLGQLNNKTVIATAETCDGLAVDWVNDVLYWTDSQLNTLSAARLDGTEVTVLISENMDEPRDIALDPVSGLMFWTDWGLNPKIEKSVLDGTERTTIVSTNIAWPNGLSIDLDKKTVYWVDGKLGSISSVSYDGTSRELVLGSTSFSQQPFSISVLDKQVFWTDWKSQTLLSADLTDMTVLTRMANSTNVLLRPNGVKVVHSSLQKDQESGCARLRCQGLCLGAKPGRSHCVGQTSPDPDIDVRMGSENLELSSKSTNDSIELSLSGSTPPSFVIIVTKCIRRQSCNEDCSKDLKLNEFTNQNQFKVAELQPATEYSVEFRSPGFLKNLQITTADNAYPEIPSVNSTKVEGLNVTITWRPVNTCVPNFQSYNYRICKIGSLESALFEGTTNSTEVTIRDLEPNTMYTAYIYTYNPMYNATVKFTSGGVGAETAACMRDELLCNSQLDCTDGKDEDVSLCAELLDVTVYKKSSSQVFLRCDVSNNTRRQLMQFTGSYSVKGAILSSVFGARAVPCVIWPESYCFNVSSLKYNKEYTFTVSAALKNGKAGVHKAVTAITKEGVPGPPEEVMVTGYTPSSVVIQWRHPSVSNGIIKNFLLNINEVEAYEEDKCCRPFPMSETPVGAEEFVYSIEMGGLLPAATYAIGISAKTMYIGASKDIDAHTPPPPMKVLRQPNVSVTSLEPLAWKPSEDPPPDNPQYHGLITSYLLLLLDSDGEQETFPQPELGPLLPMLESTLGQKFQVIRNASADDAQALGQTIELDKYLSVNKEYELAWVQVSQYKDAYGLDYILSKPFIKVKHV